MATNEIQSKSSGEISTTASISATSIPSRIASISADSVDQNTPADGRIIFKSALDLRPEFPGRHLESESTSHQNGRNVESDTQGVTPRSPNHISMIQSQGNDDLRSLLGEFTSRIEETQRKIDANTSKIVDNTNKLQSAELKIKQLQQQLAATSATSNPSSSFNPAILGRMNNIVVSGIVESQGEDLIAKLKDISSKLNCELSQFKARRLGKVKSQQNDANTPKPRAVLVELSSNWEKRKLYAARTKLKNTTDYSQVFFNEDLDKNSSELFYKARQAKKMHKIKSIWTYGCQVFFTNLGSELPILLTSPSQLPSTSIENVPANDIDSRSQSTAPSQGSLRASPQATSEAAPPGGAQSEAQ